MMMKTTMMRWIQVHDRHPQLYPNRARIRLVVTTPMQPSSAVMTTPLGTERQSTQCPTTLLIRNEDNSSMAGTLATHPVDTTHRHVYDRLAMFLQARRMACHQGCIVKPEAAGKTTLWKTDIIVGREVILCMGTAHASERKEHRCRCGTESGATIGVGEVVWVGMMSILMRVTVAVVGGWMQRSMKREVGKVPGNKEHSTVIHVVKGVAHKMLSGGYAMSHETHMILIEVNVTSTVTHALSPVLLCMSHVVHVATHAVRVKSRRAFVVRCVLRLLIW